jgi:hypothetical protein
MTREEVAELNPEALFADGLDAALIGVVERACHSPVALYDRDKCIDILAKQGMTHEEAVEFFEYNTLGAWVGDQTPAFATIQLDNGKARINT